MTIDPTTLHTERLTLRPWSFADIDDVVAYADDAEYSRFLNVVPHPYTHRDGLMFVARQLLARWDEHAPFAIEIDGRAAGGIDLTVDHHEEVGTFGYSLARRHWGQGYMSEAVSAVIDWAFTFVPVVKIRATADAENQGSWRVMEKCGMQREAYFRSHRLLRGERRDIVEHAILREDWLRH